MGEMTLHVAQIVKLCRTAATLFPRNMVCFRGIIVNTLHKGDSKDDGGGGGGGDGGDDDDDDNDNNNDGDDYDDDDGFFCHCNFTVMAKYDKKRAATLMRLHPHY